MLKRFFQSDLMQTAIAGFAAAYVTFVARTTRWTVVGDTEIEAFAKGPACIVVFWHETLPSMPQFWRRARASGANRPAAVLASRHRDGRLIAQAVQRLGIRVIAGSSSRGGAAGLRALIAALDTGSHVGLTPDGPRGPRRIAAPGVAQLAAISGAKILPCGAWISPAFTLKSWDRMRLPLPFGRGTLVCGPALSVKRDGWVAALPVIEAALNTAMDRAAR